MVTNSIYSNRNYPPVRMSTSGQNAHNRDDIFMRACIMIRPFLFPLPVPFLRFVIFLWRGPVSDIDQFAVHSKGAKIAARPSRGRGTSKLAINGPKFLSCENAPRPRNINERLIAKKADAVFFSCVEIS